MRSHRAIRRDGEYRTPGRARRAAAAACPRSGTGRGSRLAGGDGLARPRRTHGRGRRGLRRSGRTAAAASGWRRLLDARALLALPARPHTCDLFVRQWTEMGANRHIHRAQEVHDLIAGYPELACHVVHPKLTHTRLLKSSSRARVHQRTNTLRQLAVNDSDRRCGAPPHRLAELCRTRRLHPSHSSRIQQRHHLLETVARCIGRHNREG